MVPGKDKGKRMDMLSKDDHGIAYVKTKDGLDVDEEDAWNRTNDRGLGQDGVAVEKKVARN